MSWQNNVDELFLKTILAKYNKVEQKKEKLHRGVKYINQLNWWKKEFSKQLGNCIEHHSHDMQNNEFLCQNDVECLVIM